MTMGGLERSSLAGSVATGYLFDDVLERPSLAGLLMLARGGGGRIEPLPDTTEEALGGRPADIVELRCLTVGRRLGDWLVRLVEDGCIVGSSSAADKTRERGLSCLVALSAGLRIDRVRGGRVVDDIGINVLFLLTYSTQGTHGGRAVKVLR